jgi:hypothetical protein
MKKISICLALGALLFALSVSAAEAQQPGKIYRIGFLDPSNASSSAVRLKTFWEEIFRLGWIEGKNFTVESRFAEEKTNHLPELAAEADRPGDSPVGAV